MLLTHWADKSKVLPEPHRLICSYFMATVISVSIALSETQAHCESMDCGLYTFIIHCAPDNYPAFAGTNCT